MLEHKSMKLVLFKLTHKFSCANKIQGRKQQDPLCVLFFIDNENKLQVIYFYRNGAVDSDLLFIIFKYSSLADLPFELRTRLRNVSSRCLPVVCYLCGRSPR